MLLFTSHRKGGYAESFSQSREEQERAYQQEDSSFNRAERTPSREYIRTQEYYVTTPHNTEQKYNNETKHIEDEEERSFEVEYYYDDQPNQEKKPGFFTKLLNKLG